jgi:hypothetical protein
MVLGLSLEKLLEARAENLPGRGRGVRRHCLEGRARASSHFASSGRHPSYHTLRGILPTTKTQWSTKPHSTVTAMVLPKTKLKNPLIV